MPALRELVRYLCSRDTLFTVTLLVLYAVMIRYCASVGNDDANRYERFDSDEHIPFDEQLASRFSEFSIYTPDGAHGALTAPFSGGPIVLRILTLDASHLETTRAQLVGAQAMWTPPAHQNVREWSTPILVLLNVSLATQLVNESPDTTAGTALGERVCQALKRFESDYPSRRFVPVLTPPQAARLAQSCGGFSASTDQAQIEPVTDDLTLVLVPSWKQWLTELWESNSSIPTTTPPPSLQVAALLFADPAYQTRVPRSVMAKVSTACGALPPHDNDSFDLLRLCTPAPAKQLTALSCCVSLLNTTTALAKVRYGVSALHGIFPTHQTLPELGIHWMGLAQDAGVHAISLLPRTPIASVGE